MQQQGREFRLELGTFFRVKELEWLNQKNPNLEMWFRALTSYLRDSTRVYFHRSGSGSVSSNIAVINGLIYIILSWEVNFLLMTKSPSTVVNVTKKHLPFTWIFIFFFKNKK